MRPDIAHFGPCNSVSPASDWTDGLQYVLRAKNLAPTNRWNSALGPIMWEVVTCYKLLKPQPTLKVEVQYALIQIHQHIHRLCCAHAIGKSQPCCEALIQYSYNTESCTTTQHSYCNRLGGLGHKRFMSGVAMLPEPNPSVVIIQAHVLTCMQQENMQTNKQTNKQLNQTNWRNGRLMYSYIHTYLHT